MSEEQVNILPLWLPSGDGLDFAPIHHPYYHLESISWLLRQDILSVHTLQLT